MIKEREVSSNQGPRQNGPKSTVTLIESGLDDKMLGKMYKKLKNEGKCCEGGSEGWTG